MEFPLLLSPPVPYLSQTQAQSIPGFCSFFKGSKANLGRRPSTREQQEGTVQSKSCHFAHNRGVLKTPGASLQYLLSNCKNGFSGLRAGALVNSGGSLHIHSTVSFHPCKPVTTPQSLRLGGKKERKRNPTPVVPKNGLKNKKQGKGRNKSKQFTLLQ